MAKNNSRSFRYSDEVALILQEHNNDLDALVLECYYKLPQIQKEVKELETRKGTLRKQCNILYEKLYRLKTVNELLDDFKTETATTIQKLNELYDRSCDTLSRASKR